MNYQPKFLIVTPSYNHALYIEETINSVLKQSYRNFEYFVVDGNSSDSTVSILKRYEGKLRWVSERDKGYADAVRKGFVQTDADYLMWLPSDDLFFDDRVLANIVEALNSKRTDVVYGEAQYIDESGSPKDFYKLKDFDSDLLLQDCFICQPATAFSRAIYERVGGIDPNWKSIADYDLWLRFSQAGASFQRSPKTLAKYRLQPKSITMSQRGKTYREIFDLMLSRYGVVQRSWIHGAIDEVLPIRSPHGLISILAKIAAKYPMLQMTFSKFLTWRYS